MNSIEDFYELLNKVEDLHPLLTPYVNKRERFYALQHPLIFKVPYSSQMNALINRQFMFTKEAVDNALKEKNYTEYIWLHERPYRINAFADIQSFLDDKTYWTYLGELWTDSENIWQNFDCWVELLSANRKYKKYFMCDEDRQEFKKLPNEITIYRGCVKGKNEKGLSYTTNKEKAEWFSMRLVNKGKGDVLVKTVKKNEIFAYVNTRNEYEIILKPQS